MSETPGYGTHIYELADHQPNCTSTNDADCDCVRLVMAEVVDQSITALEASGVPSGDVCGEEVTRQIILRLLAAEYDAVDAQNAASDATEALADTQRKVHVARASAGLLGAVAASLGMWLVMIYTALIVVS